jgi:phosphoserine phosphatase
MFVLTLFCPAQTNAIDEAWVSSLCAALAIEAAPVWLEMGEACDIPCAVWTHEMPLSLTAHIGTRPIDWCVQETAHRRKKLLISDMDSTIIQQECIDELADMVGKKAEVSAITERAMQGELDFSQSLIQRVALLEGIHISALQRVWEERITASVGAETLVRTLAEDGVYTLLVSGGFTFFTEKVAAMLGFHAHYANVLEIVNDQLTGRVMLPILDKDAKRRILLEVAAAHQIQPVETVAIGDGANDAAMIEAAGLGVAYHAKPYLRSVADMAITHTDLSSLLHVIRARQ